MRHRQGCCRFCCIFAAVACRASDLPDEISSSPIPTADAIKAVKSQIDELTRDDFAALKAKKKTNVETADALLGYIDADVDPASKYLLRQMAFQQYVFGAAFDKAEELYSSVREERGLEYALGIAEDARHKLIGNAAKSLKERISADDTTVRSVVALKAKIAKSPADANLCKQLAFVHVASGDWESALRTFRECAGEVAKVAAWELDAGKEGAYDAAKVARFWWEFSQTRSLKKQIAQGMKVHACGWYRKADALGLLSGIDAQVAHKRIEECEAFEVPSPQVKGQAKQGPYMVVNLEKKGPTAVSYLDDEPKGGWGDEYRMTKIVLRRIAPGSFEYLPGKSFKITKPFYIGVFEVTQKQYEMIMKEEPSRFNGDMRPVERVSYTDIRGTVKGLGWPNDNNVDDASYLGKMRKQFWMKFDLPTEVQWEYACRAGTNGKLNVNGVTVDKLANSGSKHTVKVGSLIPNAWGLYDMLGNVSEWCLDRTERGGVFFWGSEPKESKRDPKGATSGSARIVRGGSCVSRSCDISSSRRVSGDAETRNPFIGFRLVSPPDTAR